MREDNSASQGSCSGSAIMLIVWPCHAVDFAPAFCNDAWSPWHFRSCPMRLDPEPYCDFRMTVRVEIPNIPGQFARLAAIFAEEGANLGAIDIVEVRRNRMVRDITFDAQSEAHA